MRIVFMTKQDVWIEVVNFAIETLQTLSEKPSWRMISLTKGLGLFDEKNVLSNLLSVWLNALLSTDG